MRAFRTPIQNPADASAQSLKAGPKRGRFGRGRSGELPKTPSVHPFVGLHLGPTLNRGDVARLVKRLDGKISTPRDGGLSLRMGAKT
eukprot:2968702-Pyramimonas_sp.AAC.1